MQKYVDDLYKYAQVQGEQMGYWPKANLIAKSMYDYLPMCEEHNYKIEKLNFIGITHNQMGLAREAIKYFEEALTLVLQTFNENHDYYAKTIANFGISAGSMAYVKEAIAYLKIALRIYQKHYSDKQYDAAVFLDYIGFCFEILRIYDKAQESHLKALTLRKMEGHNYAIARSLNNLGTVAIGLKNYQESKELFTEALALKTKAYHPDHPEIAITTNNFGLLALRSGDAKAAAPYFEKALTMRQKTLGRNHPAYIRTCELMGEMFFALKDYKQAMIYAELARKFREHFYVQGHPEIHKTYHLLQGIHRELGNIEQTDHYQKLQEHTSLPDFAKLNFPKIEGLETLANNFSQW